MKKTTAKVYTIDAKGVTLGRVATQVAKILNGKDSAAFEKHIQSGNTVRVINASLISIRPEKKEVKVYQRYSGYPGGLTEEKMSHLIGRKGMKAVIEEAVYGMLPRTKHRSSLMKQLTVEE